MLISLEVSVFVLRFGGLPLLNPQFNLYYIIVPGSPTSFAKGERELNGHLLQAMLYLFWKMMVRLGLAEIALLFDGDPNKSGLWQNFLLWEPIALNKEDI